MKQRVNQKLQLKKKSQNSPIVIQESKSKSLIDNDDPKHLSENLNPPTFSNKPKEDSYCGPKLPLNAFQCFLKALGNHTTK
jgi:hypothetical protein